MKKLTVFVIAIVAAVVAVIDIGDIDNNRNHISHEVRLVRTEPQAVSFDLARQHEAASQLEARISTSAGYWRSKHPESQRSKPAENCSFIWDKAIYNTPVTLAKTQFNCRHIKNIRSKSNIPEISPDSCSDVEAIAVEGLRRQFTGNFLVANPGGCREVKIYLLRSDRRFDPKFWIWPLRVKTSARQPVLVESR